MSCEVLKKIGTGDCECKNSCKSDPNLAKAIASELVSEILENALDIVEECDDKKLANVGDIMENLPSKLQGVNISEENLNMKEDISEKHACCGVLTGLGDQLSANKEVINEETIRYPPVEKKNRLTDLVKNSKQVLAKLILNENRDKSTFDAKNEKVLRVIDLDTGNPPFKVKNEILPENVPLPRNDSMEILEGFNEKEDTMDEIQLFSSNDVKSGNGDDVYKKTMTFPLAGSSGRTLSIAARCRTLKFPGELRKKKWNIGSKIINYIRKHKKGVVKEKEIKEENGEKQSEEN